MALRGIDIASHQAGLDVASVDADFVIVKATQGTGYTNPYCVRWVEDALALGKCVGVYHYIGGQGAVAETDFFIDSVANWVGRVMLCLDWESYQNSAWRDEAYLEQCIRRVIERTGIPPMVYSSQAAPFPWDLCDRYNCGRWVAQYASMDATGYQDAPWNEGAYSCAIRQYTSAGRIAGWSGNLDLNKFYGDREAWDAYCGKATEPAPEEPEADPKPPLPDAIRQYVDLDSEAWYVGAVEEAVTRGFMTGYDATHFGPTDPVTRAQAVCAIARAADAPMDAPFSDVVASPYYYEAIEWAKETGVVNGDMGEFRPEDHATRAEVACFLCNWRDGLAVGEPTGYPDWEEVPDWARNAVAWAVEQGVLSGSGGRLLPNATCSRAECAAMISNLL